MTGGKIKVLYIYANTRKQIEEEWRRGEMPDTYFIGLNHLKDYGIKATYLESRTTSFLHEINFNLTNLVLLPKLQRYDFVFTGASLSLVFLAKVVLRLKRPKFIFYNTFLTKLYKNNRTGIKRWIVSKSIKAMDAIICPSQAQIDYLKAAGFNQDKIYFIPTGVDADFFDRQGGVAAEKKDDFILSVGKDMGRDYRTLVEAVKNLEARVVIVAYDRNMKGIGELPANVSVQSLPFKKLLGLYQSCLFTVLPTKKEEELDGSDCSGHYAMLDAMAAGKAVIASRRSTLNDYLGDGSESILVEPENPEELARAIRKLLNDRELAARMGANAKARTTANFTTRLFAEKLFEVIFKLSNEYY